MAVRIKNVSTAQVSINLPIIKLNRQLMPKRVITLTDEEYEELTFDPGAMALINGHYLVVEGLEENKQADVVSNVYTSDAIEKMLLDGDITGFAKFIPNATIAEKESAVTLAVEHKITNAGINALIKKYCGVDVIDAISKKHDAEEK